MARRFNNMSDCRRYLASVLNRIESGEMEAASGTKVSYITSILARIIEGDQLERRIKALEDRTNEGDTSQTNIKPRAIQ